MIPRDDQTSGVLSMNGTVQVEFEGKIYSVSYKVERGLIHVSTAFGSKDTQVGNSPPESLARLMGRELLAEAKDRRLL